MFVYIYCLVGDAIKAGALLIPRRPGPAPACTDAELLTIALVRHLLGRRGESGFLAEIWTATGHDYENLRVGMQDPVPGTNALSDPGRGIRDGRVGVRRGHVGAGASEGLGDGPADSLVAAGSKSGLAAQRHFSHRIISLMSLRLILPMAVWGKASTKVTFFGHL